MNKSVIQRNTNEEPNYLDMLLENSKDTKSKLTVRLEFEKMEESIQSITKSRHRIVTTKIEHDEEIREINKLLQDLQSAASALSAFVEDL